MIFILTMGAMRTKSSSSIITDLKLGCFKNYMRPGPSPRDSDLIGPRGPRSLYSEIVLQVIISLSLLRIIFHDIQRPGVSPGQAGITETLLLRNISHRACSPLCY